MKKFKVIDNIKFAILDVKENLLGFLKSEKKTVGLVGVFLLAGILIGSIYVAPSAKEAYSLLSEVGVKEQRLEEINQEYTELTYIKDELLYIKADVSESEVRALEAEREAINIEIERISADYEVLSQESGKYFNSVYGLYYLIVFTVLLLMFRWIRRLFKSETKISIWGDVFSFIKLILIYYICSFLILAISMIVGAILFFLASLVSKVLAGILCVPVFIASFYYMFRLMAAVYLKTVEYAIGDDNNKLKDLWKTSRGECV
jgi:hypothetical protein